MVATFIEIYLFLISILMIETVSDIHFKAVTFGLPGDYTPKPRKKTVKECE
jgi:hypothetical protein